jgi:hypothetical protein
MGCVHDQGHVRARVRLGARARACVCVCVFVPMLVPTGEDMHHTQTLLPHSKFTFQVFDTSLPIIYFKCKKYGLHGNNSINHRLSATIDIPTTHGSGCDYNPFHGFQRRGFSTLPGSGRAPGGISIIGGAGGGAVIRVSNIPSPSIIAFNEFPPTKTSPSFMQIALPHKLITKSFRDSLLFPTKRSTF